MNHFLARAWHDWVFYFHQAKAEMGIASSWEPLAYIAQCGGPSRSLSANKGRGEDRRLAASRRHARIEAALIYMPSDALSLIRLACEEQTHTLRLAFGELGNVAHLSDAALKAHKRSQTKRSVGSWLDRLAWKCARETAPITLQHMARDIRRSCEAVMDGPRDEYVKALGRI